MSRTMAIAGDVAQADVTGEQNVDRTAQATELAQALYSRLP